MVENVAIHWSRILIGGLLAEALIFAGDALVLLVWGQDATRYSAGIWSFVMTLAAALWTSRSLRTRFVLHGALVGCAAVILFTAITLAAPLPLEFWIAHALKLLGGAAGGLMAKARSAHA